MTLDMEREMAAKHLASHPVANHKDAWFYVWVAGLAIVVGSLFTLLLLEMLPDYNAGKYYNGPADKVSYHETDAGTTIGIHMTEGYYEFVEQVCNETPEASVCD